MGSLPNVVVHPIALGDSDGDAALHVRVDDLGQSTLLDPVDAASYEVQSASVRHAGRWAAEAGITEVDVLKIDVEGLEVEVLQALRPAPAAGEGAVPRVRGPSVASGHRGPARTHPRPLLGDGADARPGGVHLRALGPGRPPRGHAPPALGLRAVARRRLSRDGQRKRSSAGGRTSSSRTLASRNHQSGSRPGRSPPARRRPCPSPARPRRRARRPAPPR